jgi:ADP-dependent NAD(P)H-hydrate dehydratase / NAD(P)H-hydrate epimerase
MKILSAKQIKAVDEFTISNEPIASVDLMERAALACEHKLMRILDHDDKIIVVSGKGNNGGDGMAIARLLYERGFQVKLAVVHYTDKFSEGAQVNYDLYKSKFPDHIVDVTSTEEIKLLFEDCSVTVDAIFGSGLNKPVEGLAAEVIDLVNKSACKVISIDLPSGLFTDSSSINNKSIIKADLVLSLHAPKLAFFMPENHVYVGSFDVLDISLNEEAVALQASPYFFPERESVAVLLKKRNKFDHKGKFGHALLVAGSKGKAGAAVLSASACLRSGAGLLTVHSVKEVTSALLCNLPEAMSNTDVCEEYISEVSKPSGYDAVGFGPGVGTNKDTETVLKNIIQNCAGGLVIDADGLNILSENKTWLAFMMPSVILTPHIKEFERLAGKSENDFDRLEMLRQFSIKHGCIVILKGAYSAIAMPDGNVFFNSSGNPGLAKGGSGDVLTGIILGLLARGYTPPKAALIGTYIHGYAADLCTKKMSMESILASDVIKMLPKAFRKLEDKG